MKIKLDNKYHIETGYGGSFVLVKKVVIQKGDNKGDARFANVAYADIPILINRYATEVTNETFEENEVNLMEYVNKYKDIIERVTKIMEVEKWNSQYLI